MKKLIRICAVATIVLAVGSANTQAAVNVGTWIDAHPDHQAWHETIVDGYTTGGPREAGNVFWTSYGTGVPNGFALGNAVSSGWELITGEYEFKTTYTGGLMVLFGGGWGDSVYFVTLGNLTVYSNGPDDWDPTFGHRGQISWMLETSGTIDDHPLYTVNFTATNGTLSGFPDDVPLSGYGVGHTNLNGPSNDTPVMWGEFGTTQVTIAAIPEPGSLITWGLLGAGAAGLGVWRRRRRGATAAPWIEENRQAIHQIVDRGRLNG